MARNARKQASNENVSERHTCRECSHSHDWFDKAHDGYMILGYCPYKKEGKYAILLNDKSCQNFTAR